MCYCGIRHIQEQFIYHVSELFQQNVVPHWHGDNELFVDKETERNI